MQTQIANVEQVREDFTILKKDLVYLDSSATSLTPDVVLEAMNKYYKEFNANVHRGIHTIGQKATEEYEGAHKKVAEFINAEFKEIVFTKSATEALNLLAYTLIKKLNKGDEIVLTEMEHHSNLVPWQQLAKERELIIKFIKVNEEGRLENPEELITTKTKIVSITHMSNVLGTINNVKEIAKLAHEKNALLIVDAAQSAPHFPIDVKDLDCDFLAFSGHKMCGPTGIGVLYGKKELLEDLDPFLYGGSMISEVHFKYSKWNDLPWKFEAGTPNIAEAIGLGKAIDYLREKGMENIKEYEEHLAEYALKKLKEVEGITIYGPKNLNQRGCVIAFNLKGIHPHDVSTILDRYNIAIRAGHMCAMPLVTERLNTEAVCRASLYFYNTTNEVDKLIEALKKAKEIFKI